MMPERWKRTEELYHAARGRPAGERAAFLADACREDEELRRDVESLLNQPVSADGFLAQPALAMAAHMASDLAPVALIGRRVGGYHLQTLLGAGGMGEVYRARDTKLGRDVAIKILPQAFTSDPDRLARFEREARMLAALNHPNICAIYGLEEADPSAGSGQAAVRFLILEVVDGETLAEKLAHKPLTGLPVPEAISIARQVADALEAAHEKGIVHRDLKPANIKITPDGAVKVLDFGLAKAAIGDGSGLDLTHSPTVTIGGTREGAILGTAAYMSPEQARGQAVDKRTDIWAFGCVLYEMLTGRSVFARDTISDTSAAILEREPDWTALPAATPASIRRLLGRCLTRDPKRRLRDIADASLDLAEPGPAERTAVATKPHRLAWIAVAVLSIVAVAALIPAVLYFGSAAPTARDVRLEISLPSGTGSPQLAISPDGRRVVYRAAAGSSERTALWVRSLNAVDAEMLPGTDGATFPFWSRDSRFIGFSVYAERKLKWIEAAGGPPQNLADVSGVVQGGTWNRDGIIVFASTVLRRIAVGGGATDVTDVTELDTSLEETLHAWPSFLPDGRHFLYLAWSGRPENRAVYIGSLESKTRTRLMAADSNAIYAAPGFVLFRRGETLMARPFDADRLEFTGDAVPLAEEFSIGQTGKSPFGASDEGTLIYRAGGAVATTRQWVWVDRTEKRSRPVGAPLRAGGLRLSLDGKRVAFSETFGGSDVVASAISIYDLDRNVRDQLTTDPSINHFPIWSPDETSLLFDSSRGKNPDGHALWEMPANGATPQRLLLDPKAGMGHLVALDWSRDWIVFSARADRKGVGNRDLWMLPLSGDRNPRRYLPTPSDQSEASLSPNGRWLAYTSNESGSYQVIVQSFPDPTRDRRQISLQGGAHPRWSRDGREIYYLDPAGRIVAVAITADQNLDIGKSTSLFDTSLPFPTIPEGAAYPYDVTSDGQQFLISTPRDSTSAPIIVVLNWVAGLKRQ